jgi:hypothetical protein
MSDQFDTYRVILKLAQEHRTKLALRRAFDAAGIKNYETESIPGYYRRRRGKDGPIDPVGIWFEDDELHIYWGKEPARPEHLLGYIFSPVPYQWWKDKMAGKPWPDEHQYQDPIEGKPIGAAVVPASDREVARGDNAGEQIRPSQILADQIDVNLRKLRQYDKIVSDEHKVQAQTVRSDLLQQSREAHEKREELLAPHRKAVEEINREWKSLEDKAQDGADKLRFAMEAWRTEQLKREREERERLEQERLDHEAALKRQADEAAAAVERGEPPPEPEFIAPPVAPERTAPPTSFKGATGRAAHERTQEVITEEDVEDWKMLFLYFVPEKESRAFILKRANTVLKRVGEVPAGCKTRTVAKVA